MTNPPCEICGASEAFDALEAFLCTTCIELKAALSPDTLEACGKQLPRGSQERRALLTIANWQRQCWAQPRARQ